MSRFKAGDYVRFNHQDWESRYEYTHTGCRGLGIIISVNGRWNTPRVQWGDNPGRDTNACWLRHVSPLEEKAE